MTVPQFGIFAQGTIAHAFVEFDLRPDVEMGMVAESFQSLRQPAVSAGGVNLVVAFGSTLWRALAGDDVPAGLAPFQPIAALGGHRAPASQHDIWLWINGSSRDVVFEHSRAAAAAIGHVATVAAEQDGFVHHDSRDLTGFIDGTANPQMLDAPSAALVPDGQPGAGGSHVLAMRWIHDLAALTHCPSPSRSAYSAAGSPTASSWTRQRCRRPPTSPAGDRGRNRGRAAHLAAQRAVLHADRTWPLLRRFSADRARFVRMLARMFGTDADGQHDRLMDFSRPVSGAFYFAPSLTVLADLSR